MADDEGGDFEFVEDEPIEEEEAADEESEEENEEVKGDLTDELADLADAESENKIIDAVVKIKRPAKKKAVDFVTQHSNVSRTVIILPLEEMVTSKTLQLPEMARAIGIRATQIANNSPVFTDKSGLTSAELMAMKELVDRKNPLRLRRVVARGANGEVIVEEWKVREMDFCEMNNLYSYLKRR